MEAQNIKIQLRAVLEAKGYRPSTLQEIAMKLAIPARSRSKFANIVNKMHTNGEIVISENGKLLSNRKGGEETAKILSVGVKGAQALLIDKKINVLIYNEDLNGAMPSDIVSVKVIKQRDNLPRGVVMSVKERGFVEFVGTFHRIGKNAYVTPNSKYRGKIKLDSKEVRLLNDNDMIFAKMKNYARKGSEAMAEIISAYGSSGSARACCQAILDRYHIRREFSGEVVKEAKAVSNRFEIGGNRTDLRDKPIFTIDGATAKDLDDAVSVDKIEGGYRLGVHIADVSHYVTASSQIDTEAFERGTSVYYADMVVPMLPKQLSNGICSLNPNEDRLTFSASMDIDGEGKVIAFKLEKSVIRSRVKGVYSEVNKIFDESADEELLKKYAQVLPSIGLMRELALLLHRARIKRGAFDIETDESELVIGENGIVVDVKKRERGESEKLIEEFMLCANEAVATYAFDLKLPFVYRVHEEPELTKLQSLAAALMAFGIDAKSIRPGLLPSDVSKVLLKIADSPKSRALNSLVLRSMAKARYTPECVGHFGLSLKFYCHFTSPIRRYPDLAIHRILSDVVTGGASEAITARYNTFVAEASLNSSAREVSAMQTEWDCEDAYKAEYMVSHIGEQFHGTVSSVKGFGLYIVLENTIEGLVRIENLPGGWYDFNEQNLTLSCSRTGSVYAVGDSVNVIVARADVPSGQIDFTLI
jgi:ribonuclease R